MGEERLSTVGSVSTLMTAENEFAAFAAQWNTSIRGNPTPSPDAWDYFRRWSVWNSNSFHHGALDTIRTSFLLLAVELNNRVKELDYRGLGTVDVSRFQNTRTANLAVSRYTSFEEGYSFSKNCTTCVNLIALTTSGLSACTLFEDLVHGIGSPMQSRCSAYQKSIPAAVPFPKGIEVNRWFRQHIDTRDLSFLARVLYEMYRNELVEVLDNTGATYPVDTSGDVEACLTLGGRVLLSIDWDVYSRARFGDPTNARSTVRASSVPSEIDFELIIVLGETLARALGEKNQQGTNQYKIRQDLCKEAELHSHPHRPEYTHRVDFATFLSVFSDHGAGHMADSYLLRNLQDSAGANHLLHEEHVYLDPDVLEHNRTRGYDLE